MLLSNRAAGSYGRPQSVAAQTVVWRGEKLDVLSRFTATLKLFPKHSAPKSPYRLNSKLIWLLWTCDVASSQTTALAENLAAAVASPPRVSHTGTQVSFPWQPPLRTPQNKYDPDRHKDVQTTVRSKDKNFLLCQKTHPTYQRQNCRLWCYFQIGIRSFQRDGNRQVPVRWTELMLNTGWDKNRGAVEWSNKSMRGSVNRLGR